jgi:hypothetical protein
MTVFVRACWLTALLSLLPWFTACGSRFEPPQLQGPAAMVDAGGQPQLWVLSKLEEVRRNSVGGGLRQAPRLRDDTFFHFELRAFDPLAATPLWTKRLLTVGDSEAQGSTSSRVIGSAVGARLLGQDGSRVWLVIGDQPLAVNTADGQLVADGQALQHINPELAGLLPSEGRHYAFDRGLVVTTADARRLVIRGPALKAVAYVPAAPAPEAQGRLLANGRREPVPMRPPIGEVPTRQTMWQGEWLGLYSEKEAADAARDDWGRKLRYPYTILDEGTMARRSFWRARIVQAQHFDDRFERLDGLTPVAESRSFLKGRFMNDARTGTARLPDDGDGVFVWHSTRVDDAGRLALARVDSELQLVWDTELPLSEASITNRIATWQLPGHVVVTGWLQTRVDGVTSRLPHLVSIDLKTGEMKSLMLAQQLAP